MGPRSRIAALSQDRRHVAGRAQLAYLAAVIAVSLLPPQLSLRVGELIVPLYRLLLLAAVPWLFIDVARGSAPVRRIDLLMLALCAWIFTSVAVVAGFERAINAGSAMTLDIGVPYFLAAWSIRSVRDLQRLLVMIAPAFFLLGALALPFESIYGDFILQPLFVKITGNEALNAGILSEPFSYMRHGLLRATGSWPHPILAGLVLASLLPFALLGGIKGWPKILLATAASFSVFTVSSSAFLALAAQGALLTFEFLSHRVKELNWRLFLWAVAIFAFATEFGTQRGVWGVLQMGALNATSAAYRSLIWEYGTASVVNHPFFGIAYGDWERLSWMPDTIDNYWLNLAVHYGLPALILAMAVPAIIVVNLIRFTPDKLGARRNLMLGTTISLAVMVLGTFSVSLWASSQAWLSVLLGIGAALVPRVESNTVARVGSATWGHGSR